MDLLETDILDITAKSWKIFLVDAKPLAHQQILNPWLLAATVFKTTYDYDEI